MAGVGQGGGGPAGARAPEVGRPVPPPSTWINRSGQKIRGALARGRRARRCPRGRAVDAAAAESLRRLADQARRQAVTLDAWPRRRPTRAPRGAGARRYDACSGEPAAACDPRPCRDRRRRTSRARGQRSSPGPWTARAPGDAASGSSADPGRQGTRASGDRDEAVAATRFGEPQMLSQRSRFRGCARRPLSATTRILLAWAERELELVELDRRAGSAPASTAGPPDEDADLWVRARPTLDGARVARAPACAAARRPPATRGRCRRPSHRRHRGHPARDS